MNDNGEYFKYESPKGKSAQQTFIKEIGKYSPVFPEPTLLEKVSKWVKKTF